MIKKLGNYISVYTNHDRWEAEQVDMPFKTAVKIARYLDVNLEELAE